MLQVVKVEMKPTSVIDMALGIDSDGPAQKYFQETCYKHMDRFVPKRRGDLRDEVDLETDPTLIIYEQEYALIQYYGIIWGKPVPEEHYTTPGTGPYWDQRMVSADKEKIVKEMQDYIESRGHNGL